ncbi:MAG: hypothetical protein GY894_11665 [Planctomycetes bacterium]|jgi:hypothetical protein|nr:hypothetical protein [Planctomycetota bacterium]MCP4839995.1 hypothetical protein [Planctomycetota bacterium]
MKQHMILISVLSAQSAAVASWCGSGTASIPDDGQSVRVWTAQADELSDALVVNARLYVSLEHSWVGDLTIEIASPDGTAVTVLDRPGMPDGGWVGPWGCGGDDIMVLFDDSASEAAEDTCTQFDVPVLSGNKRPLEPLSAMYGVPAAGAWQIRFSDASPIDAGTVLIACLTLETSPDCNGNGIPDIDDIAGGGSEDGDQDGVPDECQCAADLDGNAVVNVNDVLIMIGQFGSPGTADLDGDGLVDTDDLLILLAAWGNC